MKINACPPSLEDRRAMMQADPLRNPRLYALVEGQTPEAFSQDLCRRMELSRWDPRIAESCVERILLFPARLDLNTIESMANTTPWIHTYLCLMLWAQKIAPKSYSILESAIAMLGDKATPKKKQLEAYYIDLHAPSSARTQEAVLLNDNTWERCGFWAATAPYSKELIQRLGLLTPPKQDPARREAYIAEALKDLKGRHLSLSEIDKILSIDLSCRHLQRILKKTRCIKISGKLKGTRYSIR